MADIKDSKTKLDEAAKGYKVTADSNFPSVRGNFVLKRGAWYYEAQLLTAACMQIGFADAAFDCNSAKGSGVGDHAHSWAYDGWRQKNGMDQVRDMAVIISGRLVILLVAVSMWKLAQ